MKKHQAIIVGSALLLMCAASCASRAAKETTTKPPEKNATAGALTVGTSEPVRVSAERADAAEPSVAAAPDGAAYVVWVEHHAGKEADVMLTRLDRAGRPAGAAVRVNAQAGAATAWRGDPPSVAVASEGGAVHVVWTARLPDAHDGGHANILYLSTSRDGGRTFEPPVKINDDEKPAVHGMHSMAVAADGRVHVAWLDERNVAPPAAESKETGRHHETESNREVFVASSGDGGRTFSANRRIATEACPCCKTSLLAARDGRVYAGWRQVLPGDFRHIAVASSEDRGETFSAPVIVSDDRWVIAGCPVSGAALADGADGALRVLWYSAGAAGAPGLYWAESRDAGRTFGARQLAAAGEARGTPLLLTNARNEFVALGEEQHGGAARLVAARLSGNDAVARDDALAVDGELPAAVATDSQFVIAYVVKAEGRREVWLVRAKTL